MSKLNFITPIGDDFIIPLTFLNADGSPGNLTGCAIELLLKPFDDLPDDDASVISYAGTITNPTGGLATVSVPNANAPVVPISYYYKIKLTTSGGVIVTFAYGVTSFTSRGSSQIANQGTGGLVVNLGTGVTVAGGGEYYVWQVVTGNAQALVTGYAYIPTGSTLTTFTLPLTASVGDHYTISGMGTGGWKLAQNASQQITIGSQQTTSGVTGYLASTNKADVVEVVCVGTNEFQVTSSFGNITVN